MTLHPLRTASLALALLFCAGLAQAQYVWITPNGTRQYSDQPPPPGTPASKILKNPGRAATRIEVPAAADALAATPAAAPEAAGATKKPTLAERELDYRKRAKEREQAEAKAQADARAAAARAERCAELAKSKKLYESGVRVADVDAKGESHIMTDAERAERAARATQGLNDCR